MLSLHPCIKPAHQSLPCRLVAILKGHKTGCAVSQTYFRRYRCCMSHSKAPSVLVDGQVVRWCQQCCCFHELSAFDDDKRCRLHSSMWVASDHLTRRYTRQLCPGESFNRSNDGAPT